MNRLLAVLDEAMTANRAAYGKIRVLGTDGRTLDIAVQRGFSDGFVERYRAIPLDSEIASARAFREGRRVVVADFDAPSQDDPYTQAAFEEGFRSMQSTPALDAKGRVVATLSTHSTVIHRPTGTQAVVLDFCARRSARIVQDIFGRK